MALLERILLPVDFSDRSRGAARFAEALARKGETEIYLVHVAAPLNYELSALDIGGAVVSELNADRTSELREQLHSFLEQELQPFQVHRILLEGDPAKRIVEFAHNNISLIAMPTHGYGLFRRFLLGSVTAKVLHDADCPVWTGVHLEEAPPAEKITFRKIMIAVDLGPQQALKAISWGSQMAELFGCEAVIVHAYPSLEGRSGEHFDPNWRTYFSGIAAEEIAKLQRKLGVDYEVVLDAGDPPQVVCRLARVHQADVLVIGRGSASGVFGRLRANAYAIIRQSPCPVVSV
jgi:nucleotide-binding universal stress UspA family protein